MKKRIKDEGNKKNVGEEGGFEKKIKNEKEEIDLIME